MIPLQPDTSYHIYNHANGFENILSHEANYKRKQFFQSLILLKGMEIKTTLTHSIKSDQLWKNCCKK